MVAIMPEAGSDFQGFRFYTVDEAVFSRYSPGPPPLQVALERFRLSKAFEGVLENIEDQLP